MPYKCELKLILKASSNLGQQGGTCQTGVSLFFVDYCYVYITVAGCGYALQPCLASVLVCARALLANQAYLVCRAAGSLLFSTWCFHLWCSHSRLCSCQATYWVFTLQLLFSCPLTAIASINFYRMHSLVDGAREKNIYSLNFVTTFMSG